MPKARSITFLVDDCFKIVIFLDFCKAAIVLKVLACMLNNIHLGPWIKGQLINVHAGHCSQIHKHREQIEVANEAVCKSHVVRST